MILEPRRSDSGGSSNQHLGGGALKGFSEPDSGYCLNLASTLGEFGVLTFGQGYQLAQEVAAYAATGSASVLCWRSR